MLGVEEVLLISVIVLVVFGPDKLPEVARMLGKATREFRKIASTAQRTWDEIGREMELEEARAQARQLEADRAVPGATPAPEEKKEAGDDRVDLQEETGSPVATADNGSGEKQAAAESQHENETTSSTIAATDGNSIPDGDSSTDGK